MLATTTRAPFTQPLRRRGADAARRAGDQHAFASTSPCCGSGSMHAIERGVIRRSRRVTAPTYVAPLLPARMIAQRVVELVARRGIGRVLDIARAEHAPLTTPLPDGQSARNVRSA